MRGDTTGFAHTADLSEAGLRERRRGRRRGRAAARRGDRDVVALERRDGHADRTRSRVLPETVEKARKAELLERADARRPRR